MQKILENIKLARKYRLMSQEQAAEKLNISLLSYSKIERGITELSVNRLKEIALIFDTSIDELLGIERSEKSIRAFDSLNKEIEVLKERIRDKQSIINNYDFSIAMILEGLGADIVSFFSVDKFDGSTSPLYELIDETPYCSLIRNDNTVRKIEGYLNFKAKEWGLLRSFYLSDLFELEALFDAMDNYNFIAMNKQEISFVVDEKINEEWDEMIQEQERIDNDPRTQKRIESMRKFREGNG
jgi:transcriptional regulator with XRE-family HTH domain